MHFYDTQGPLFATRSTVMYEALWDGAITFAGAYAVVRDAAIGNPLAYSVGVAMVGVYQPILTYYGFDEIISKRFTWLSPILATALCDGISLALLPPARALSDQAKLAAAAAISLIAIAKGVMRTNRGIYPSLRALFKG